MCGVSSVTNVYQFVKNLYRAKVIMLFGVNDTMRENPNLSCVPKCVYFNDMELLNQQGSVCTQSLHYRSLDNKMQKLKIFWPVLLNEMKKALFINPGMSGNYVCFQDMCA